MTFMTFSRIKIYILKYWSYFWRWIIIYTGTDLQQRQETTDHFTPGRQRERESVRLWLIAAVGNAQMEREQ